MNCLKHKEGRAAMAAQVLKIGGIYIDKGQELDQVIEFGLFIGGERTIWFEPNDTIESIYELTEIGGVGNLEEVEGYSFGINKVHKTWHVKDTGHKHGKHILWQGQYKGDRVEKEIAKLYKSLFI